MYNVIQNKHDFHTNTKNPIKRLDVFFFYTLGEGVIIFPQMFSLGLEET